MNTVDLPQPGDSVDFERRFGGIRRLYGARALETFRNAHVCVLGLGGVGSWAKATPATSRTAKTTILITTNHLTFIVYTPCWAYRA